jgi:CheY-like chemotaxis protein
VDDDPFLAYSRKFVLERSFRSVERATDAAEAFIRLDEPGFADRLALVIVGLHEPGLAGPEFVNEITARIPGVPVLVIGRLGEIAPDYSGEQVCFLPRHASTDDLVMAAAGMLAVPQARIA